MDTTTEIKDGPLVTILMLTYNRAHFLPEAIESVIHQTYQNWELVIIDDGSTDRTTDLMTSYTDPRIRYIRHDTNAGLHSRRRESLTHVRGQYAAILDSDDKWLDNDKLTSQVEFLEAHLDYVLVGTNTELINAEGAKIGVNVFALTDKDIRNRLLLRNQFTHSSVLIRSAAIKKTNGYQPTLAEDLELFLQLGNIGKLANLPEIMTAHRVHGESANDHGILMNTAVYHIIMKHRNYPGYWVARLLSTAKILWYRF